MSCLFRSKYAYSNNDVLLFKYLFVQTNSNLKGDSRGLVINNI